MKMRYLMVSKEKNPLFFEGGIEKSVPHDHRMSSLGKPRDSNWGSPGRIFLSHPRNHDRFFQYEFHIPTVMTKYSTACKHIALKNMSTFFNVCSYIK